MTRYEHTQIGHVIIWSLLAIILIASGGLIGSPSHREPPVVVSIILLVCLVLFYRLRITIEDETLRASFGPGIIRKRVRLAEIVGCEPIRIRWWYGWGIHLTPYGWLYNVSGFDAVAITLRDGRKFALGTDDPHGLVDAIRRYQHAFRAAELVLSDRWTTRSRKSEAFISPIRGTNVTRRKFAHHLLRARRGKCRSAFVEIRFA